MKYLFLMCGVPGAGKSTWINETVKEMKYDYSVVSRDAVRFAMLKDDEDYFAHENEVFEKFCDLANEAIATAGDRAIFVDATHLNEKARNKVLDKLHLSEDVHLYAVNFEVPVEVCLERNEQRTGRAYVPKSAIRRMAVQFEPAAEGEKYNYEILTVTEKGE